MTKKDFKLFVGDFHVTCKYSGKTKTMYLFGSETDLSRVKVVLPMISHLFKLA